MWRDLFFLSFSDAADRKAAGLVVVALRPDVDAVEAEVPSVGSGTSTTRPEEAVRTLSDISAITAIDAA